MVAIGTLGSGATAQRALKSVGMPVREARENGTTGEADLGVGTGTDGFHPARIVQLDDVVAPEASGSVDEIGRD